MSDPVSKAKKKIDSLRRPGNCATEGPNPFATCPQQQQGFNMQFHHNTAGFAPPNQQTHPNCFAPPNQHPYNNGPGRPQHPSHTGNHGRTNPQQKVTHGGNAAAYGHGQSHGQDHLGGWGGPAAAGAGAGAGVGVGFAATPYTQHGGTRPPQGTAAARMTKQAEKFAGKLVQKGKEKRDKRKNDKNMKRLDYNSD